MFEIIAHRGASHDAPENTLAAIRLAWQQDADAVEIDCRLTADGQVVVIHDADTQRVASRRLIVAQNTLSDLRRLDYGRWKGTQWAGEPLPLLDEVIATMPQDRRLFVEVKCGVEILPALTHILEDAGRPPGDVAVISYHAAVLSGIKQSLRGVNTYLVARFSRPDSGGEFAPSLDELIAKARDVGLDGLDVEARPFVDAAFVARAAQAGLACYVWTVNSGREAGRLRAAGVHGITTDRPGWLRTQLGGAGPPA